jgi:hypothetical protein
MLNSSDMPHRQQRNTGQNQNSYTSKPQWARHEIRLTVNSRCYRKDNNTFCEIKTNLKELFCQNL